MNYRNDTGYKIRGYIDRGKCMAIQVANMVHTYYSERSSSKRGWDLLKGLD